MTMTATATERKVWIGCLRCYNAGSLIGEWFDASEAGEVTTETIHPHLHGKAEALGHEEIWCFDIEGFGHWNREMSPSEAGRIDAALTEICDRTGADVEAVLAWANFTGNDADELDGFEDDYHGEHDSAEEFVENHYEECYGTDALGPLAQYIDWERVARDWGFDGWHFHGTGSGSVYVFGP